MILKGRVGPLEGNIVRQNSKRPKEMSHMGEKEGPAHGIHDQLH
jgi:hypothetical protein